MSATPEETRRTERGDALIDAKVLRGFARAALEHDAAQDQVNDLLFDHVVTGKYHPSVVADSLQPILIDLLEAIRPDDWQAVADQLIANARAALEHVPPPESRDR